MDHSSGGIGGDSAVSFLVAISHLGENEGSLVSSCFGFERKLPPALRPIVALAVLFAQSVFSHGRDEEPTLEQAEFFEKNIRPVLNDHCFECHSAEKQESDLRLDSRESMLKGGASGPAINVQEAEDSLILRVLRYDGDVEMPPDQKLEDETLQNIKRWIEMGAPWPKSKEKNAPAPATMEQRLESHQQSHWSYQSIRRPRIQHSPEDLWSKNAMDRLVLRGLRSAGLEPSPEADRYTLVKRLYIGLLGIPPTFAEIQRLNRDESPDWYEELVDRLLASPRYGERWGRHWLDVARYADTKGYSFQKDRNYPHAYTFRDYVIKSLNSDKPFDRFVMEQLAADQLDLGEDLSPLAALGFLTVGRKFNNPHDDIDDKIDVVSRGLMGLTVACARCHDHKYDAIPTADYYSLYGVFASCREGDLPYVGLKNVIADYQSVKSKFSKLENELSNFMSAKSAEISEQVRLNTASYFAGVLLEDINKAKNLPGFVALAPTELIPRVTRAWRQYIQKTGSRNHPVWLPWVELAGLKNEVAFSADARKRIELWKAGKPKVNSLILAELESNPPAKRIDIARIYGKVFTGVYLAWKKNGANDRGLSRLSEAEQQIGIALFTDRTPTDINSGRIASYLSGSERAVYQRKSDAVSLARKSLPQELDRAMVVADLPKPVQPVVFVRGQAGRRGKQVPRQFVEVLSENRKPFLHGSGRRELAELIVSRNNPLTARVIANRVWIHHMGDSLVDTPSDFGTRCPKPVQNELLDYLADELMESGWSLKHLHRVILLSAVFRQSSRQRKDGLNRDPANRLYWRANLKRFEFEALRDSMLWVSRELDLAVGGKSVDITKAPFQKRRAVYGYIDRQDLPNLLRAFDFASPDQSSAERTQTTVPQQLLFMMNSDFVLQRAEVIARQIQANDSADEQVRALYRLVLAREPTSVEFAIGAGFLDRESGNATRLRNLAQILLLTNEFCFAD